MLIDYDEFPVHQTPLSFSSVQNTDICWNEGLFYCVYDRQGRYLLFTYFRVHPNTDTVDGCVGIVYDGGHHYTIRFSRRWRPEVNTRIGPFSINYVKPFKEMRLVLEENEYDLSCDISWLAIAPAFEEAHHRAEHWGKATTDMTRYNQNGTARGWIKLKGERIEVDPSNWWGCRDHSWGLYPVFRPELAQFMPPPEEKERAFRMWNLVCFEDRSEFYGWHEDHEAKIGHLNDEFGTPFEGRIDFGFGEKRAPIPLADLVRHDLEFAPGSRMLQGGTVLFKDSQGKEYEHEIRVMSPPWLAMPIAVWNDGRFIGTYRGSLEMEQEEMDLTVQPSDVTLPGGRELKNIHGAEYLISVRERSDDGVRQGWGFSEFHITGRYARYGFDKD